MGNKEKEAFWKGYLDFEKSGGHPNPNPIIELIKPVYDPPRGREEAYKAGWEKAKQDRRK
ncbi:MAG: hypothetical protein QXN71_03420 [Candidatus Aenigmatarchaeota archaeon]